MIYLKEGNFPLNFSYDDNIVQEKNNTYQLSFKFPTNKPLWESLTEETLLLADDLHGEQEFIIFEVERHHGYITVYANQVATLLNNYSISELSVSEADGNRVMRSLVSSIIRPHNFTFYSDIAARHSLNLKNVTVATALFKDKHSILGQWGGDLVRDKYSIKLLANGGNNNEALFMYKKNLKTYQQKKSTKDLRTRIHFTKTINAQNDGEQDKVLSVTADSPLINKYKNIYEGNLEVNDQDVVDEASLLNYVKQYYKNTLCDVLEESIEIDVIGVDTPVKMFDTVTIFHEKFNLDVKKKITKYTFSPMSKKLKTIGFGVFQQGLGSALSGIIDEAVTEKVESRVDAFKIQKNLAELLKKDRTAIEEKMKNLEEQSKAGVEVKRALFEKDGTVPEVTRTKILDAIEADIVRLKTIITEAEMIKAIQAHLNYAKIKTALIDKAFITQILSDETFRQQFEAGEVTTQNIFTKMRDSIQSSIKKEFITKEETKRLVNDLTIGADGIRQITQEETNKIIDNRKDELKGKDGVSNYIHTKYSNNENGNPMTDDSNSKYIGIYTGESKDAPTNASEYSWTKIAGEDGKKGDDGEKAHTLTADLRLEGRYLNGVITGFKAFLTVLYDGSPLPTSDVVITHSYKGAGLTPVNFTKSEIIPAGLSWPIKNLKVDTDTADGTPLYVNVLVQHFKGLRAVASARLDNTVDVELVNDTVKKFKTFESTLDKFESKISEVDSKRFKLAYTRENLCSETAAEKKGSDLYFNTKKPLEANKEYYILADVDNVPENQNTRIFGAKNNGDGKLLVGGLNIWKVSFEKAQTNVNIFPLGGETKVKNVQIYEVPETEEPKEDVLLETNNNGFFTIKFKRKIKANEILTLTFDVEGTPTKRYGYYYGINGKYTSKPILSGKNSWTFRLHEDKESVQFTTQGYGDEGKLSNVKCVLESFAFGYKTEYNISEMESTVRQTKSEIDLSVKKNEVINSINLSGEGVKINADKVDISGTLSAYTGKIGTFSIGQNDHASYGRWITGVSQYQIGISDGTNGREGAAIWVNWGNRWNKVGEAAWYVRNDGQMFCKNLSYFGKKITAPGGIDVYKSNVYGLAASGHTTPIWWSEFEQLKSQISDSRLKENIQPTKVIALDTLNQIEMVEFNWKKDGKFEKLGAIAQQVKNIDQSLVVQHFEDKDTPTDYLRINYFDTIPYLIKAVQELTDICVGLQEEVKQLKERSKKDGI